MVVIEFYWWIMVLFRIGMNVIVIYGYILLLVFEDIKKCSILVWVWWNVMLMKYNLVVINDMLMLIIKWFFKGYFNIGVLIM